MLKTSDVLRKDPDTITGSSRTFSYEVSCVHQDFESTFQGAVTYMLSSGSLYRAYLDQNENI